MYCDDVEIDYKQDDLTFEAILNLFRGRYPPDFPENKKLKTNSESKLFVFFNGHGGDNFFKIQDTEVLQSEDLAKVFNEMNLKNRYKEVWMLIDTCQAMTLFDHVDAPNLILMGTSIKDKSAYSHQHDDELGTDLNDKFSYYFNYKFLRDQLPRSKYEATTKISDLPKIFSHELVASDVTIKSTLKDRDLNHVLLKEYLPMPSANIASERTQFFNLEDLELSEVLIN